MPRSLFLNSGFTIKTQLILSTMRTGAGPLSVNPRRGPTSSPPHLTSPHRHAQPPRPSHKQKASLQYSARSHYTHSRAPDRTQKNPPRPYPLAACRLPNMNNNCPSCASTNPYNLAGRRVVVNACNSMYVGSCAVQGWAHTCTPLHLSPCMHSPSPHAVERASPLELSSCSSC